MYIKNTMDGELINIEHDTNYNLLQLLERKMVSLQIAAKCHEQLTSDYRIRSKLVNYSSILIVGINFIMGTLWGENEGSLNIPMVVTSGIALILKGSQQYCNFAEKEKAHKQCWISALDMADDIEYVILKNNHTAESLQHTLDIYDERIKSFRKNEEHIPMRIKLALAAEIY